MLAGGNGNMQVGTAGIACERMADGGWRIADTRRLQIPIIISVVDNMCRYASAERTFVKLVCYPPLILNSDYHSHYFFRPIFHAPDRGMKISEALLNFTMP